MKTTARLPTLFLSHGSPMLAVQDSPAGCFLDGLGDTLQRPKAIVVASAHFIADRPTVGAAALPATVHDFGGFPAQLYDIEYPALGEPGLAEAIAQRLSDAGLRAEFRSVTVLTMVSGCRCCACIRKPIFQLCPCR